MEQSLTNRKDNALSLPYLTEFVGDVKELEEQIFTLEGVRDRLQEKIVEMRKKQFPLNVSPAQVYSHLKPRQIKQEIVLTAADEEEHLKEYREKNKDKYKAPETVGCIAMFLYLFGGCAVLWVLGILIGLGFDLGFGIASLTSPIAAFILIRLKNKSYERKAEAHNAELDRVERNGYRNRIMAENESICKQNAINRAFNAELDQKNAEIDKQNDEQQAAYERRYKVADAQRNAEKAQHNAKISMLEKEHSHLCQTIKDLKERRSQLYALDIIPPSYRTYDCVHGLYDIFLNRKKDNMPDAVVLYDDYVFQGLLIKGMGTIIASLGQLTGMMTEMGKSISRMQGQISSLSMDMYDVAERQNAMSDTLTSQHYDRLRESRLGRYELESISSSLEKIAKHCD